MRKSIILPLLGILVLFQSAVSQVAPATSAAAPKKLIWSEEPACGLKNASITPEDKFTCSLLMEEDWKLRRFEYNGLVLTVKFTNSGEYFVAETRVTNKGSKPISFNPQQWLVVYFESEEAFKAGEKPLSGANPVKEPFVSVLSNVRTNVNQANDITDLGRTVLTRERGETVIRQTPAPARPQSGPGNTPTLGMSTVRTIKKLKTLTEKTVAVNKEADGNVYFAFDDRSDYSFVSMQIEGVFYVFPIPRTGNNK
jgi:hypothetical protein